MRIEVVPTVDEIKQEQIAHRLVIVIDVLRASSTIVTALASGFSHVIPVETVGQAYALRSASSVLAGERHCKKIAEFDYNNSPTSFLNMNVPAKHLILTTTNGTRAIQKADRGEILYIGCLLNASACIKKALGHQLDVTLYCAGTRQEFALEDGLAAGYMIHLAKQSQPDISVCDLGVAMEASYLTLCRNLYDCLLHSTTGKRLVQHQFIPDIQHCSQTDVYDIVPVVKEKRILPSLVS